MKGDRIMKRSISTTLLYVIVLSFVIAVSVCAEDKELAPRIQLAILLDTSGSMSGLIHQAKAQLWEIVNEFIKTEKNGKVPELHVALYEYGNSRLSVHDGYIRMILPLTRDLDKVSEQLFALKTGGGEEFCGQVIQRATNDLEWSSGSDDYKVIVIAGNEPFSQGTVNYKEACARAIEKGIIVNTIHCGSKEQGIRGFWQEGAQLADGQYSYIDQNKAVAAIEAPQDKELAMLGTELNKTYIPYGAQGMTGAGNQSAQDTNAASLGIYNLAQRSVAKASTQYTNSSWDLVDAVNSGTVSLEKLKADELPDSMKSMKFEEQKQFLEQQVQKRSEIQEKIKNLAVARNKFIVEKEKEMTKQGEKTLGTALLQSLHQQAEKKQFVFK